MKKFICYLYSDYRKEVSLQHLRIFSDKTKAIEFATKYADASRLKSPSEYVSIQGTVFDAPFLSSEPAEETMEQDNYQDLVKDCAEKYEAAKKELKVDPNLWYIRIAVDEVEED